MKTSSFIIFLAIVLLVYGLVNTYVFIRGLQCLPPGSIGRIWYSAVFWFLVSAYVIARILERTCPGQISYIFTWIGSFWLAFMLFFVVFILLIDVLRLSNAIVPWFPSWIARDIDRTKIILFFAMTGLVSIHVLAGFINARFPRVRRLDITVPKKESALGSLKIVMVSDIHLGTLIAKDAVNRLVGRINRLQPELILLAGDVVDEDLAPVIKENIGESLTRLQSKYGVYGITGNHEYIGGAETAVRYLTDHGVHILQDSVVLIRDCFYLAGREDRDKPRFTGKGRKSLEEVLNGLSPSYPLILMDHQPFGLEKAAAMNIDLQLSGHTHHGQIWPLNYITKAIYTLSWGYKKIGNTHFYVSCGYGTWGPPVRLGNRPEIVLINIKFEDWENVGTRITQMQRICADLQ